MISGMRLSMQGARKSTSVSANIYSTDFEEYTVGVQPNDWIKSGSTEQTYTVEDIGGAEGKVLRASKVSGTSGNSYLIWDSLPNEENVEALFRMRFIDPAATHKDHLLMVRVVDDTNHYRGDYLNLNDGTTAQDLRRIGKRIAGSHTELGTSGITDVVTEIDAGDWWWMRVRIDGDTLSSRLWLDANAEPGTWDLTTTDTGLTGQTGKAGIANYRRCDHEISYFSVGVAGESPPLP